MERTMSESTFQQLSAELETIMEHRRKAASDGMKANLAKEAAGPAPRAGAFTAFYLGQITNGVGPTINDQLKVHAEPAMPKDQFGVVDSEGTLHLGRVPPDPVNHPPHYKAKGLEAIDVMEAFAPTNIHRASALKYLLRAGRKTASPIEDLEKARWYIERELAALGGGK